MLMERAKEYRALRAPAADGQTLVEPPWDALPATVARNREHLSYLHYDVQGRSLADLSRSARQSLLAKAVAYTCQYREVPERWKNFASLEAAPFLLSGHQPELFH